MDFPLTLSFKLLALSAQATVREAGGGVCFYVRQKAFRLRESITVYADEAQTRPRYTIEADRLLDFSARYAVARADGTPLGVVQRRGMRSLWKARYEVLRGDAPAFAVQEENPWAKVVDGLLGEIPVLGLLTGYLFHPAYTLARADGTPLLRLVKEPAFFEGRYRLEAIGPVAADEAPLAVMALFLLVLLEKNRG